MKKLFFTLFLATLALFSSAQLTFKAGLFNSLNIDESLDLNNTRFGSALAEIGYNHTGTLQFNLTSGWLRHQNSGEGFSQFPVLVGVTHRFDETFYAGFSLGASWYDSKISGTNFTFSPVIGLNVKKLSVDLRYVHAVKNNPVKIAAVVLSYNF